MDYIKAGFSVERLQRVSRMVQGYIERKQLSCASVLINRGGEVALREKFGWQDLKQTKPLEFNSLFRIMSMTKPITAVAAMLLYEEGYFDLNTPIYKYLPAFEHIQVFSPGSTSDAPVARPVVTPITFRHLFTHSSGIGYGGEANDQADKLTGALMYSVMQGSDPCSIQGFVGKLAQIPLAFEPGTSFRYGLNLDVLGALVEVISGQSLPEFLETRIFKPLGMVDTAFEVPEAKKDRLVDVYTLTPETLELDWLNWSMPLPFCIWGGGGLASTLDDYARFTGMLAGRGEIDGLRLLSPTTVAMFSQNWASPEAVKDFSSNEPDKNGGYGYSLGTAVLLDPSPTGKFGNPGEFFWGGALHTYFWIDPKEQLFGIFMTQFSPNWAYPIPHQLKQLTYQALVG
jgi:CubicO group peptidase (beta-lactamase class C family)